MDFDKRKEGIFSALTSLVFPKICIYCQVEFAPLCLKCQQFWLAPVQRRYVKGLAVNSTLAYNAASSRIIIQAKESRNRVAQFWMARALNTALEKFELENPALSISHCLLVPIPSSKSAIRKRGGSFLHPILDQLVELQKQKMECAGAGRNYLFIRRALEIRANFPILRARAIWPVPLGLEVMI